jgi:hypothetical protein
MKLCPAASHRADDYFLVLEGGWLFCKILSEKGLRLALWGKEACYATTQGAVQIRRGGDDTNINFRHSRL